MLCRHSCTWGQNARSKHRGCFKLPFEFQTISFACGVLGSVAPKVLGSMSAKRTRTLPGVQITMQLTVKGGLLNQPRCLEAIPAVCEGREVQFVAISNSDDWLCHMASGKGKSTRPLARCKVMVELRRKSKDPGSPTDSSPTDSAIVDPMNDMLFEDSAPAKLVCLTPNKNKQRRETSSSAPTASSFEVVPVLMKACPGASADVELTQVLILTQGPKMLIDVDALSWLLNYLMDELDSSGVDPVLESPKKFEAALWWDFRDDCWAWRSTTSKRKTASVRRRMVDGRDLEGLSFEEAKQRVYDEIVSSQAASESEAASAVVEATS